MRLISVPERKLAERETLLRDVVRRLEEANSMLRQKERELQKFRARVAKPLYAPSNSTNFRRNRH